MSIFDRKRFIDDGSPIIVCVVLHFTQLQGNSFKCVKITTGGKISTKFGLLEHNELIGKEYGIKMFTKAGKGPIFILHPTPYLWTLSLRHVTQILYSTDISVILHRLNILNNQIVVEAGTGSGALTHSIAAALAPNGRLFTFEFHEERYQLALETIKTNNLDPIVTVTHRNVLTSGFGLSTSVDSVVLDLPRPWEAIANTNIVLKRGGCVCIFSPCIEQVKKTVEELDALNFCCTEVLECLERPYLKKDVRMPKVDQQLYKRKKPAIHTNESPPIDDSIPIFEHSSPSGEQSPFKLYTCAVPPREIRGHSGYLIFSRKQT